MIDLKQQSGLPIQLNKGAGEISFYGGLASQNPVLRYFGELRDFLFGKAVISLLNAPYYHMYREIAFKDDKKKFLETNLRYDITTLIKGRLKSEYVKTIGHFHPQKPGTNISYPEIYEIIFGSAYYLLQKLDDNGKHIKDFIVVRAKAGDKVVIPPDYGHVTVNPLKDDLVMANLVSPVFKSDYQYYKNHKGAAYYVINEKKQPEKTIPNPNYEEDVPPLREAKPKILTQLGIDERPLYSQFAENPEKFRWLNEPENFIEQLKPENVFSFGEWRQKDGIWNLEYRI